MRATTKIEVFTSRREVALKVGCLHVRLMLPFYWSRYLVFFDCGIGFSRYEGMTTISFLLGEVIISE